jgi:DNA polymerase I
VTTPALPAMRPVTEVRSSPLDHVQLKLVESLADANELARWLGERRDILGVDTESEGLVPAKHDLRLIQVGDRYTGWAIPWPLWGGLAQELLHQYAEPVVMHHSKHDQEFLRRRGSIAIPWASTHDTMIELALNDPTQPKGLKSASARKIDRNATAGERLLSDGMKQFGWTWATVPHNFPPYWIYAALDPVLTCWLHHGEYPTVAARHAELYRLELAVARIAGRMSGTGMMIDQPYVHEAIEKLTGYGQRVRAWLKERYGITSLLSARQLYAAFASVGWTIQETTPSGLPKVDKETLEGIANGVAFHQIPLSQEEHPEDAVVQLYREEFPPVEACRLAKVIIDARHAEKINNSYLSNFLEFSDADGIVHCGINTIQARTGRMSISEPALQQLSRNDKIVRGAFIPRPGNVFVTCDFSQIEMRLAAALSEDERLITAFAEADNGGQDFYSGIASELFGERVEKHDPRRQAVKTISYAKLYGAGLDKMARTIGLPAAQVKAMRDAFDQRFPNLDRMARRLTHQAYAQKKNGERAHTFTTMGRYMPCDSNMEYALLNYRFQGEAADILKRSMVEVANAGLEDAMRLPVHDELILEVPAADAQDVMHTVIEAMTDRDSYAVPITCDAAILTERWAKV